MNITCVQVSEKDLFDGVKVKVKRTGLIKTIKVLKEGKTIYQSVLDGDFNVNENIDFNTVMNNKHLFELVEEDI